jgi:hypothetical protein
MLDQMYTYKLGWEQLSNTNIINNNDIGRWWHGGAWNPGWGRAYRACAMVFDEGLRASVVTNSAILGNDPCDVLKDAYDSAELWLDSGDQTKEVPGRDQPNVIRDSSAL